MLFPLTLEMSGGQLAQAGGVGTHCHPTRLEGHDVHDGLVFRVRHAVPTLETRGRRFVLKLAAGQWDHGDGTRIHAVHTRRGRKPYTDHRKHLPNDRRVVLPHLDAG